MPTVKELSVSNIRKVFTIWEEEYRANPETFMDEITLKSNTPEDLGELRATYFISLLDKVRNNN